MYQGVQGRFMAAESDADTERVAVKTYIPAYQREEWQTHADELGMSRSEFVRTMVQAGRRGFLTVPEESEETDGTDQQPESQTDADGAELTDRVQEVLSTAEHLAWEELLEALTDDIESRLEDALAELQDDNRVRYSGRHGGYTLVEQ